MQKALRINVASRLRSLAKGHKKMLMDRKNEEKEFEKWASRKGKALREERRAERRDRREDWINGELAANRNVGLKKGALGTVDATLLSTKELPSYVLPRPEPRTPFQGNEYNIVVGDRVCVVRGVEGVVGKIGTVKDVTPEKGELTAMDVNMGDVQMPAYLHPSQRLRKLNSVELPLKFSEVRLVVAMTDPETGQMKDTIVRALKGDAPYLEQEYGSNIPEHTRYIAGQNIKIEWPEPEIMEHEFHASDTSRQDVEEETYVPAILSTPMPEGVENELFVKHGWLKMKRDNTWIQTKIVEDARSAWYGQRRLLTPKQQYLEKMVKNKHTKMAKINKDGELGKNTWKLIEQEQQQAKQLDVN